jgi:hypothetical protein
MKNWSTPRSRFVNTSKRPVPGGFIQRKWLGDKYSWRCFDEAGNPISVLGVFPKTMVAATAHVAEHAARKKGKE